MLTKYDFTYNNAPAHLMFSDVQGELSEIWYLDKGVNTRRVIEEFSYNEKLLQLKVQNVVTVFYNDLETIITGPDKREFDATTQESLEYFMEPSTPDKIKRMQVNGTAIEYLNMILFNPETGEFAPAVLPAAPAPVE